MGTFVLIRPAQTFYERIRDAISGSYVELTVPVKNTGDRPGEFHMAGVAESPSGTNEELDSVHHVVREGAHTHSSWALWPMKLGSGC